MKLLISLLASAALLGGCASTRLAESDRLALHRGHAGAPVNHFNYFGSINGWTPLGDSALTVWTRPNQAYLLELAGPCPELDFAPAISISNQMGRVSARFDKVTVQGRSHSPVFPCHIREIRPLDVKALKQAERDLRKANAVERETPERG